MIQQRFWRYRLAGWAADSFAMFLSDDKRFIRRVLERRHGEPLIFLERCKITNDSHCDKKTSRKSEG